jgi:hypothetical protein
MAKKHAPVEGSQKSVVQTSPSSQSVTSRFSQSPVDGLQASVVQASPSSQSAPSTKKHPPPAVSHKSVVQALPSSHTVMSVVSHSPVDKLQVSVVQALPSSQTGAPLSAQCWADAGPAIRLRAKTNTSAAIRPARRMVRSAELLNRFMAAPAMSVDSVRPEVAGLPDRGYARGAAHGHFIGGT